VRASRSDRTWRQYQSAVRQFERWCEGRTRAALAIPASPDLLRGFVTWLADRGLSVATIQAYIAALASAHRLAGHPFDWAWVTEAIKGIARKNARQKRRVRPMVGGDIQGILSDFAPAVPSDARDAALLALGFAGALRRSELVGIDWQKHGDGDGFVVRDDRGIVITLLRSKAGKGEPVEIICPHFYSGNQVDDHSHLLSLGGTYRRE
jgi:integrase